MLINSMQKHICLPTLTPDVGRNSGGKKIKQMFNTQKFSTEYCQRTFTRPARSHLPSLQVAQRVLLPIPDAHANTTVIWKKMFEKLYFVIRVRVHLKKKKKKHHTE